MAAIPGPASPPNPGNAPSSASAAASAQSTAAAAGGGNWWGSFWQGIWAGATGGAGAPGNPLSQAWASLGAGIETGFIATLKDIWSTILGPLEILFGFWLIWMAILLLFAEDVMKLAAAVGPAIA